MVVEQSRKRTGSATNKLPVFIRLKPSEKQFGLSINDSEILIKKRSFQSKCIFQNCSQEALYNHVGSPMIAASLRGVSSTLLTIGASGTGKNYTLFGGNQLGFDSGLIIRVLENIIFNKEKLDAEVYAYEVCPRDQIMDLIKPSNTGDVTAGGKVIGISIAKITSRQDISYFLSKIIQNTSKGCHKVINIQVTKTDFSAGEIVKSNIVFIQLSPAEGNALISRQHSLLEHVFVAMKSRRDPAKIPFRQSKLTHSLQMALFRRSNISILCTIDPSELHINYTIETLRFSSRISNITITQKSNKPIEDPVLISKKLKKEVETLKRELSFQSLVNSGRSNVGTMALNATQIDEIKNQVNNFLSGGNEPEVVSLPHLKEIFEVFRQENQFEGMKENTGHSKISSRQKSGISRTKNDGKRDLSSARSSRKASETSEKISKVKNEKRETEKKTLEKKQIATVVPQETPVPDIVEESIEMKAANLEEIPDRDTLFKIFCQGEGKEISRLLNDAKKKDTDLNTAANKAALTCNEKIAQRKAIKKTEFGSPLPDGRIVYDEEEYELMKQVKSLKNEIFEISEVYKVNIEQAKYCHQAAISIAERLLYEFEKWEIRNNYSKEEKFDEPKK